jgi:hypothetical protein
MKKDVVDKEVASLYACNLFARRDNVHHFLPPVNPNRNGVKALALGEVSDEVCAHDLKRLQWHLIWNERDGGQMGLDFIGLILRILACSQQQISSSLASRILAWPACASKVSLDAQLLKDCDVFA